MFFPSPAIAASTAAAQNVCMMHDLSSHVHSSGTLLTTNIPTEEDRGCVCSLVGRVAAFLHRELAPIKKSHDIQVFS